jgi:hypothetical protein
VFVDLLVADVKRDRIMAILKIIDAHALLWNAHKNGLYFQIYLHKHEVYKEEKYLYYCQQHLHITHPIDRGKPYVLQPELKHVPKHKLI